MAEDKKKEIDVTVIEVTEEYLKKYVKTAPKEAYYTFYRIESVPLFLSSHKVKINRPKHTTYPIGELVKLKISGEK